MTTILLIRHAMHQLGPRVLAGRLPGISLSPEGFKQAAHLVQRLSHLPIAAIYCSPLERTRATAQPLAQHFNLPIEELAGMTELDFGPWGGRSLDELDQRPDWRQWNQFRSGAQTPAHEMMLDVQARAMRELLEIHRRHNDQCVAVISHGDVIRCTIAYCLGVPLDLFRRIQISLASVSVIVLSDAAIEVLCVNNTETVLLTAEQ